MAGFRVPLSERSTRMVVGGAALAVTLAAAFQSVLALADADIVLRGEPAAAMVVEVGRERTSRGARLVEVKLVVANPTRGEFSAWSDRPMRLLGGWSDPA